MSALHLNGKGAKAATFSSEAQKVQKPDVQGASDEVIEKLKQHLKVKYKNSYSENQVEEIIATFLNDYLTKMIHEEPESNIFKSAATSQSGCSSPNAVAEERESEYSSNSILDSSTADWKNDSLYVKKQILKQKHIAESNSRRISDYFGAMQVDQLDDSFVDQRLESKETCS